ncbi:histidine phosphatase family protein [Marisediminicola sp. LYQ85]|uniref:histidine phosphatase family protein n=1 Tax=Marisediminicola sp. LYQ85 TaxID=3391062 RepID=UPI003983D572
MTDLYLVRHGETDWNAARRVQGSTDIPLNDTGRAQAARTGRLLARRSWHAVVASPLSRAWETATIIAEAAGAPSPERLDAIVERAYGEAEGLDYLTLDERFPAGIAVPGRESREQVVARALPALTALAAGRPRQRIIVVTHGGVIRALVNTVEPDVRELRGIPITNGSVHSFRFDGGGVRLLEFDDPLELESIDPGAEDFVEQNPVAARDA